jgi:hypothetical protein
MVAETCRKGCRANAGGPESSTCSAGGTTFVRDDEREIAEKWDEVDMLRPRGGAVVLELTVEDEGLRMCDLRRDTVGSAIRQRDVLRMPSSLT